MWLSDLRIWRSKHAGGTQSDVGEDVQAVIRRQMDESRIPGRQQCQSRCRAR